MNAYDFTVKAMDGGEVSLRDYEGKVLLIVNTATGCGFTPQYKELQALYDAHRADGLEILDFPCSQFADQAPGTDEEIHAFCTGRFGITFPQFSKVDVRGGRADPLFRWLEENTAFAGFRGPMSPVMNGVARRMDPDYKKNGAVKWNFTKFLIGRDGAVLARFEPTEDMKKVAAAVEAALKQ